MNLRTMKRSKAKANGNSLRRGPAKGTTGKEKGPAQVSREQYVAIVKARARMRREARAAAVKRAVAEAA